MSGNRLELVSSDEPWGKLHIVYYAGGGARVQRLVNRSRAWQKVASANQETPDLVHAHVLIDGGIVAARLARRFNVPFVVSCHASRFLEGERWYQRPLDYWLARRAAARAYRLLPVSHALRRGLQRAGMRANYQVMGNVIDGSVFLPPETVGPRQDFRLLHLSDFSRQKRLDVLLVAFDLAFRKNPALRLTIAGNGDLEKVRELIRNFVPEQEAITVAGPLARQEVVTAMGEHDLFVLSSEVETQSIVLTEALLCGLPLVTTNCGGPADLQLADEDGLLVSVNDVRALAEAILKFAAAGPSSPAQRLARHLRHAPKGSLEIARAALESVYADALAAHHQKQN